MKVGLIWITVIYLAWNFNVLQELENSDHVEAMDTSTGIMNTEDRPLHTPVPSSDEVWEISYYCHYHYYAQINSKLQHLTVQPTGGFNLTLVGWGIWIRCVDSFQHKKTCFIGGFLKVKSLLLGATGLERQFSRHGMMLTIKILVQGGGGGFKTPKF